MGGNTVVALGRATDDGLTHFGHNSNKTARQFQPLTFMPRRAYAADQTVQTQGLTLPQVRQTFAVLAGQPYGCWGYEYGLNEHQLALACIGLAGQDAPLVPALTGPDLVRLGLERCTNARQAVALL